MVTSTSPQPPDEHLPSMSAKSKDEAAQPAPAHGGPPAPHGPNHAPLRASSSMSPRSGAHSPSSSQEVHLPTLSMPTGGASSPTSARNGGDMTPHLSARQSARSSRLSGDTHPASLSRSARLSKDEAPVSLSRSARLSKDEPSHASSALSRSSRLSKDDSSKAARQSRMSSDKLVSGPPVVDKLNTSSNGEVVPDWRTSTLQLRQASGSMDARPSTVEAEMEVRRRTTALKMASTSMHASTRQLLGSVFTNFTQGIDADAPPLLRLQQVLIKAKESGMSLEKIYTFFSPPTSTAAPPAPLSDHALNGDIPAARFADGIRQLNSDTFKLTDSEVDDLVDMFDQDRDQHVSLGEFEQFCLAIPHVSWRAEKLRHAGLSERSSLDRDASRSLDNLSRSMRNSKDHLGSSGRNLDISGSATNAFQEPKLVSSPTLKAIQAYIEGAEFHHVTDMNKLLWRRRETLCSRFYSYDGNKLPHPCLAVVLFNETTRKNYPTLYIDSSHAGVTDKAVALLVANKIDKYRIAGRPEMTDADKDKLRRFLHMDLVAQYVNARLHIDDEAPPDTATHHNTVTLLKLTGDEWDTMLMEKPDFLPPPPPYEEKRRTTFEDFQRTSVDLDKLLAQQHSILHDHAAPLSPILAGELPFGMHGHKHMSEPPAEPTILEDKEDA